MIRRQRSWWTVLFLVTAVFMLVASALHSSSLLPEQVVAWIEQVQETVNTIFVAAGMRGILIGVAVGTITISLRLIIGLDRPYNR